MGQHASLEAPMAEEPSPLQTGVTVPPTPSTSTAPSNGRGDAPEKFQAAGEPHAAPAVLSKPTIEHRPPVSKQPQLDTALEKIEKSSSPSASRVGNGTKSISSLWHRSPVSSAEEIPLMPIICGSPSPVRWDARSATNSRCLCAESITGKIIASAMSQPGGANSPLIPWRFRASSGFRHAASNEQAEICSRFSVSTGRQRISVGARPRQSSNAACATVKTRVTPHRRNLQHKWSLFEVPIGLSAAAISSSSQICSKISTRNQRPNISLVGGLGLQEIL